MCHRSTTSGIKFADIAAAGGPADQFDALPTNAKLQLLLVIGFFEWWSENSYALGLSGEKHYMRGGKPGFFPSFKGGNGGIPHPVPFDLFDPFGLSKNATPQQKETGLLREINNGRLAMIGIVRDAAAHECRELHPAAWLTIVQRSCCRLR